MIRESQFLQIPRVGLQLSVFALSLVCFNNTFSNDLPRFPAVSTCCEHRVYRFGSRGQRRRSHSFLFTFKAGQFLSTAVWIGPLRLGTHLCCVCLSCALDWISLNSCLTR